jgi:succinate dehydrogenase / fumarate reductase flavoprotein subunit
MYQRITDENPYEVPMKIYPAVHYTMGGLWVDYNLMSTIPGLHVLGEANFSDHGANRLGASALMQGLADGYFVIPYTLGHYFGSNKFDKVDTNHAEFEKAEKEVKERVNKLMGIQGKRTVDDFHKQLGKYMWEYVGMARNEEGLKEAISKISALRADFWKDVKVTGKTDCVNTELEKALRCADFLELGELMARDALNRRESCGGHFREESQTEENEAKRDDENFCYGAVWEYKGENQEPVLHKEELTFDNVPLTQRSYK